MKRFFCEICGGSNLLKENNRYVCQDCHTSFSLNEAKSMFKDTDDSGSTKRNEDINELYLWFDLYEKSHKYENDFPIRDDNYSCGLHFLDRIITYKNNNKKFFEKKERPKLIDKVREKYLIDYQNDKNTVDNAKYDLEISKPSAILIGLTIACLLSGIILLIYWGVFRGSFLENNRLLYASVIILPIGFFGIVWNIIRWSRRRHANDVLYKYEEINTSSLEKWIVTNKDYLKFEEYHYNVFLKDVEKYEKLIIEEQKILRSLREDLSSKTQIPKEFRDEESIVSILLILIDNKANNLNDAIRMYNVEKFKKQQDMEISNLKKEIDYISNEIRMVKRDYSLLQVEELERQRKIEKDIAMTSYVAMMSYFI